MKEKRERGLLHALLYDPRVEKPLMIAVIALSLFLAGLVLQPTLQARFSRREPPAAVEAVSLDQEETEEPWTLRVEPGKKPSLPVLSTTAYGWQSDGTHYYYINEYGGLAAGLNRIDGRLYYFAPDGVMARAVGLDVSYYNEDINWAQVAAQGVGFAIVRLGGRGWGTGWIYDDTRAMQYLHNAREAGLRIGAYFYSTACTEAEAAREARYALRTLAGQRLDLPVFVDVEESGEYPNGRADMLSRAERTRAVEAFCRVIETAGYEAGVYSGQYYYNSALYPHTLGERMIWMANYSLSRYNRVPTGLGFDIWQFTSAGQVKGIPGYVDVNVIF